MIWNPAPRRSGGRKRRNIVLGEKLVLHREHPQVEVLMSTWLFV
jgi:hypothetical protein